MDKNLEELIIERIDRPGWVTTRGILLDPSGRLSDEEHEKVKEAMKSLAGRGVVTLWRLIIQDDGGELLAAARPGLELDKDLERRGAWAKAFPYEIEQ